MKVLRIAVPLVAFLLAAAIMLPLRFAWAIAPTPAGLSVAGIDGTIWDGKVTGIAWRGVALGDFRLSTTPFDLLPSPLLRLREGSGPVKSAALRGDGAAMSITELDLRMPLSLLDSRLPETSLLRVLDGQARLSDTTCTEAAGRIEIDATPQVGMPALSGSLECRAGEVVASVATQVGGRAVIALPLDGDGQPELREATTDLALPLAALGLVMKEAGAG